VGDYLSCTLLYSVRLENLLNIFSQVVDTVLVKLYAQFEKTRDLYALLQGPNNVVIAEVESVLQKNGQYNALCILYKQHGEDEKLLESWAKCVCLSSHSDFDCDAMFFTG